MVKLESPFTKTQTRRMVSFIVFYSSLELHEYARSLCLVICLFVFSLKRGKLIKDVSVYMETESY